MGAVCRRTPPERASNLCVTGGLSTFGLSLCHPRKSKTSGRLAHHGEMSLPAALSRGSASGPEFLCAGKSLISFLSSWSLQHKKGTPRDREVRYLDEFSNVVDLAQEGHPGVAGRAVLRHLHTKGSVCPIVWRNSEHLLGKSAILKAQVCQGGDLSGREVPRLRDHMGPGFRFLRG